MLWSSVYKYGDKSLMASESHHNAGFILSNASMYTDFHRNDPCIIVSSQGEFFGRNNKEALTDYIESLDGYNSNVVKTLQHQSIQSLLLSYNCIKSPDDDLLSSQEYNVFSVYNFKGNGLFEVVVYRNAYKIKDYSLDNGDVLVEYFNSITMDLNNTVTPDELFKSDFFLNRIITKCFDNEDGYNQYLQTLRNNFNDELAKADNGQPFFFEKQKLVACKTSGSSKVFMPKVLEENVYTRRHDTLSLHLNEPPSIFQPKYPGDNKKIELLSPSIMKEEVDMPLEGMVNAFVADSNNYFATLRWLLWKRCNDSSSISTHEIFSILEEIGYCENLPAYLADSLSYLKKFATDHDFWISMFNEYRGLAKATIDHLIAEYQYDMPYRIIDLYDALPNDIKEDVIPRIANKMLSDIKSYSLVSLAQILNKLSVESFSNYTQQISKIDLTGVEKITTLKSLAELKYKFKPKSFLLNEIEKLNIESISRFSAVLISIFFFNKVVPFSSVVFASLQSVISFLNIIFSLNISHALGFAWSGVMLGAINFCFCLFVSFYLCASIDNIFVTKNRKNIRDELFRDYNIINYGKKDEKYSLVNWLLDPATSSAFLKLLKSVVTYLPRKINSFFHNNRAILKVDKLISNIMLGVDKSEIDIVIQKYKDTRNTALLNAPKVKKFITDKGCTEHEFKSWLESKPRH